MASGGYTGLIVGAIILGVFGGFGTIVVLTSAAVYEKNNDIDALSTPAAPPPPPVGDRRYRRLSALVGKHDKYDKYDKSPSPPLH